ncbi:MAG: translation initiation factor IF-2 [Patescibacteria group bacterium]|nr:translation initiation factor IF-2 [Patescibacteria group bacterium]MDD5294584.1 translation initiation factor IF-2 [Patescibacteria group bacterium]MDD5554301.1 translation initiation factor IF-2 [Patescibacteria group bacterium]
MNVTELARILKVNPQELRDLLPQLGFHIGQKAIKIDNREAQKIIKQWPDLIRKLEREKAAENKEEVAEEEKVEEKKVVLVPNFIIVRDFSALANLPVNKVLAELMKNGIFTSMNEKIDFDTAAIIGENLGLEIKFEEKQEGEDGGEKNKLEDILAQEEKGKLQSRAPVIVVMGHVDHGKTKLLDAIRKTDVVAGEAGGITQHIGAYQVLRKNRAITFIDTPGHEAFTAMRSRGARVADIAILVVAADDGVKPQTVEAFRIIEAARIPFVVAINKVDKPEADINKTKQELATQLNIQPEDWGGKIICAPVSAKTGQGVEDLLDMILLVADMEAGHMKANPDSAAAGTVVESHVDKGAGPVATILIQNGTLRVGDSLCFNNNAYGKVRALKNYKGENITEAGPSNPVRVLGLKISPAVGDILEVGEGERIKNIHSLESKVRRGKTNVIQQAENGDDRVKKVNLVIKSDVLGSAEAIEESLAKISRENIKVKIISKGLGNITEGDVKKAEDSGAQVIGFNVKVPPAIENLIREKDIKVNVFKIIYDLIDYVKEEMEKLVEPEIKRVDLGRLKVLAVFRTDPGNQIVGGKVLSGRIETDSSAEVVRAGEVVEKGKVVRLQLNKKNIDSAEENQECGLQYEGKPIIKEGDILQFYKMEEIKEKI